MENHSPLSSWSNSKRMTECWRRWGAGWRPERVLTGRLYLPRAPRSSPFIRSGEAWSSTTAWSTGGGRHLGGESTVCNSLSPTLCGRRSFVGCMGQLEPAISGTPRQCGGCGNGSTGRGVGRMQSCTCIAAMSAQHRKDQADALTCHCSST